MFRRFQWVFFRVENEWNKISTKSSNTQLYMGDVPKQEEEEEELLNSNGHNVQPAAQHSTCPSINVSPTFANNNFLSIVQDAIQG